jgi:hypothetical protein
MKIFFLSFFLGLSLVISVAQLDAQTKKPVLFEMFTNSHCGPCGNAYGIINSQVKSSQYADDIVYIFYHVSTYSDDKLYQESKSESNPRGGFYGIQFTPTVFIDGVQTPSSNWINSIGARTEKSHNIQLSPSVYIHNDNVNIDVSAASSTEYANVKLLVGVVENVQYLGRNNVSQHQYVMRTMPTTPTGKDITIQANVPLQNMFTVPINSVWNKDSIGVVFFIQDATTKEVYASTIVPFSQVSKTTSVQNGTTPIPISVFQKNKGATFFTFTAPISTNGSLHVYDVNGELVYTNDFTTVQDKNTIEWNNVNSSGNVVANGVYLYKIQIGTNISTGKFSL